MARVRPTWLAEKDSKKQFKLWKKEMKKYTDLLNTERKILKLAIKGGKNV